MKCNRNMAWIRSAVVVINCIMMCACVSCAGEEKLPEQGTNHQAQAAEVTSYRDNTTVVLVPSADGEVTYETAEVVVDASNVTEGYIMVRYTGDAAKVRMLLDTPSGDTYNYLMPIDGSYAVFPMSDGSGSYNVGIYENIVDNDYAEVFSQEIEVELADEVQVFLYPNRYVDFDAESDAVKKGAELVAKTTTDLEAVEAVYRYVTENITYDYDKAETVQSGYLPVVDETLHTGKGICFDYASLMAAMLRSQRIPTRLEIGYAGTLYHAWISVYIEDQGWIDDVIVFDGEAWVLMDPTLVSYAQEQTIKDHMENADTYYDMKYKY